MQAMSPSPPPPAQRRRTGAGMQRDCGGRKEVSGLPTSSASGNHRAHMALATGLGGDGERDAEAPRGQSGGECVGGPAGRVCRRQQRQARPRRGHGPPRLGSASTGTCSPGPHLSPFSLFVPKERGQERCRSQQFIPCSQEPLRGSSGGPAPTEGRERHWQPHEGQDTAQGSLLSPAPRSGDAPGWPGSAAGPVGAAPVASHPTKLQQL